MAIQTLPAIVREIEIKAPAAKVFAALTEPNQLVQWWGSGDTYRCTKMEADVRVGGRWRTVGEGSDGSPFAVEGEYLVVEPPHTLEFTWRYAPGPWQDEGDTIVRYDLEERDGTTLVRVTHSGFSNNEARDDHDLGWGTVLGWLRDFLAGW
jgi:uncharacterized protein YndB with AHSA1/START domain